LRKSGRVKKNSVEENEGGHIKKRRREWRPEPEGSKKVMQQLDGALLGRGDVAGTGCCIGHWRSMIQLKKVFSTKRSKLVGKKNKLKEDGRRLRTPEKKLRKWSKEKSRGMLLYLERQE